MLFRRHARLLPAAVAGSFCLLLVFAPAASAASGGREVVPLAFLGLPSLHSIIEAIAKGFFSALAGALVPGFLKHGTVATIQHLVALPDPASWGHVSELESDMTYLGMSLMPVTLAVCTLRYWMMGLSGAAHPVSALSRCAWATGVLVAYRWLVEEVVAATNTLTHAILGFPVVANGLASIITVLFGGALLLGAGGVFGAFLVIVGVVFAAGLFASAEALTVLLALVFCAGPPFIALAPIPELSHLARVWGHALTAIVLVPIGWATNDPAQPAHYAEHADCPYRLGGDGGKGDQEGGLSTTDALGLSNGATPGTSAAWTFTAPAGTSITGLTYERYIGQVFDPRNSWSPALRANGAIVPGETCLDSVENGETCSVGGPPGEGGEPAVVTGLSAHELSLGVVCQAPSGDECVTGATEHKVWATLYGATVTLSDPTPPTLGVPSGALWGPGEAGGFHKGTESVSVSADDVGGGVASIVLSADGRPVETYTAPCNYTFAQPCPSSTGTQTLTLPTTQLSDGTHMLTLVATDAAGNQSTVASEQVTVDNSAPPPPVGLSATATQAGGSTFTATWSDPAGQVAPITGSLYQVCPASGSGSCSAPATAPAAGPATVTVPGPGSWSIAVWLTNAAGNASPTAAAHTSVVVSPSGPGGSGTGTGHSAGTKSTIRVTEALRGRELVVHVSGPASGAVRVGFIGRLRGRTVASGAKTVALKHGRLTAVFRLGPRTAAHAVIRVSAKLDHELAITSTLHRHRRDAR